MYFMKYQEKWEVSIIEMEMKDKIYYKVTRRMFSLGVAETKVFCSKEDAQRQFESWLE